MEKFTQEEVERLKHAVQEAVMCMSHKDLLEEAEENMFNDLVAQEKDDLIERGWL
tara:strand:+ start:266 stop:430 length:165 start_codon:yes stop_codon:yes gene_type:complete